MSGKKKQGEYRRRGRVTLHDVLLYEAEQGWAREDAEAAERKRKQREASKNGGNDDAG